MRGCAFPGLPHYFHATKKEAVAVLFRHSPLNQLARFLNPNCLPRPFPAPDALSPTPSPSLLSCCQPLSSSLSFPSPAAASPSSMAIPRSRAIPFLLLLLLLLVVLAVAADEDDVRCLRGVNESLSDPDGRLNWNFSNTTVGFVCNFFGVSCWDPQENRVLALNLPSLSLSGRIPSALQYCRAATGLDLSSNSLSGPIPSNLCDWLPYLVTLDLSSNSLSGPIPPELSKCRFLNTLDLSSNSFSGSLPASLSQLIHLKKLDLSGNQLSGPIPPQLSSFDSSSFADNPSLCGRPVSSSCGRRLTRRILIIIITAGVSSGTVSFILTFAIWRWCFSTTPSSRRS